MLQICHLMRCSACILLYTIVHEENVLYAVYRNVQVHQL